MKQELGHSLHTQKKSSAITVIISNTVLEMGIRKPQRKKLFTV
jgi:hypothetical protein